MVGRYQIVAQLARPAGVPHVAGHRHGCARPNDLRVARDRDRFSVQDQRIMLAPTDPQQLPDWQLQTGVAANLSPQRADLNGGSLASYVRITDPVSTLSIDGDSTKGPVMAPLLPSLTYDVLIVPSEPYAPDLLHGTPEPWPQPLQLDHGRDGHRDHPRRRRQGGRRRASGVAPRVAAGDVAVDGRSQRRERRRDSLGARGHAGRVHRAARRFGAAQRRRRRRERSTAIPASCSIRASARWICR